MNTYAIRSALISALGVALTLASVTAVAGTVYTLTDLGTLGGTSSSGADLNDAGQVTGTSTLTGDQDPHAFLWDGTAMHDLDTLGNPMSFGVALNASGQVTGYTYSSGQQHAFLWDGTTMQDLGTLGGSISTGFALNDAGQVTGYSTTAGDTHAHAFLWDGTAMQDLDAAGRPSSQGLAINASGQVTGWASRGGLHAFLWDGTTLLDLGTLGGKFSQGSAINDAGQVTGYSTIVDTVGGGIVHAFLWDGATMQDLGTLGGFGSLGIALNDAGQVTGYSSTAEGFSHAFLWDGTTMQDLGTLPGGLSSVGGAINDAGQVTGVSQAANGQQYAFLWDGATMQDLTALIAPDDPLQPFVTLFIGIDINDLGQVLANGFDSRTGEYHAYLVSPLISVPEPGTLALLGLGLAGLGLTRRRSSELRGSHSVLDWSSTMINRALGVALALCLGLVHVSSANAVVVTYADRTAFLAAVRNSITDDYSAAGYAHGDVVDYEPHDRHSDAHMSAVLGETSYHTTAHVDANLIIYNQVIRPGGYYCAGCNGSFLLDFTATSIGSASGVFGVAFDFYNQGVDPYSAFVTYGDGTVENFALPVSADFDLFFGLTSDRLIKSIHLGLADGGTTFQGSFAMDNLTIGGAHRAVPEPSTLVLFSIGVGLVGRRRCQEVRLDLIRAWCRSRLSSFRRILLSQRPERS